MRHAYLIMAHGNARVLAELVRRLDHKDNDIYIHLDRKADKWGVTKQLPPPLVPGCMCWTRA